MFPYLFIFFLATILYYSDTRKPNFLVYLFISTFIGIAGFRDMIGGYDVYIYAEVYEMLKGKYLYIYNSFDKGFLTYYYLLQKINGSREFLFFASSIIVIGLHFYTIKKISNNISISSYIYFCKFFFFSFIYLRQGLAMGILWLGLSFLINKKYLWSLVFLALTLTIHKSAIIFLPFIFIAHKKFTLLQLLLLALVIIFITLTPLSDSLFLSVAETTDSEKFSNYVVSENNFNIFYLIEGILALFLCLTFQKDFYENKNKKYSTVIFNGFFIFTILTFAGLTKATFVRFTWYYFIFLILALPYMYDFIKTKQAKSIFKTAVFIYYLAIFMRLMLVFDGGDFIPYKSIFQDFDRNGRWEFMEYRQNY